MHMFPSHKFGPALIDLLINAVSSSDEEPLCCFLSFMISLLKMHLTASATRAAPNCPVLIISEAESRFGPIWRSIFGLIYLQ